MNQEKIGNRIKRLRKESNLTQQQFAQKYGVTYQAVSKWENGKNIPDIAILKQICEDYQVNLEELLEVNSLKSKRKVYSYFLLMILGILFLCLLLFLIKRTTSGDFEFRALSSSCDSFEVSGSLAYNDKKSSIYISNISYCGELNQEKYERIECTLYEVSKDTKTVISRYHHEENRPISLEEFLNKINFHVDDYSKACKTYSENSLHLEIDAINKKGKITSYKVPLKLEKTCEH